MGASGTGAAAVSSTPRTGFSIELGKFGDVAIKYLPPLLERLIAPLSLLGLMLLFLFAQETFDARTPSSRWHRSNATPTSSSFPWTTDSCRNPAL